MGFLPFFSFCLFLFVFPLKELPFILLEGSGRINGLVVLPQISVASSLVLISLGFFLFSMKFFWNFGCASQSVSFKWGPGGNSLGGGIPCAQQHSQAKAKGRAADSVCGSTALTPAPAWHEEKRENLRRQSPSSRS